MREELKEVRRVVGERWETAKCDGETVQTKKYPPTSFRSQVARDMFADLTQERREEYGDRAKAEAAAARAEYEKAMKNPPSKKPEIRFC